MNQVFTQLNPYHSLPPKHFWKNAVDGARQRMLEELWIPKFPISRQDKIITVGSCFAQHISRHLRLNGFSWIDSEPAPEGLSADDQKANGYGIFSFRTGNIYTPALLEQWIGMALEDRDVIREVFLDEARYYDPLRPAINPNGFDSPEDLLAARRHTLAAIRKSIGEANTFVFTLGLTEGWVNTSGYVYPVCPGTIKGTFQPEEHRFHNYDYQEIVSSLSRTFAAIRRINPSMRFLLTVSPVPLTATFSSDHVLPATTYSKSVLRAAAGFLAANDQAIDYFPSYELISSPIFDESFFTQNKRTVTEEGVALVMRHFMTAIGEVQENAETTPPETEKPVSDATVSEDVVCEDVILEQWARKAKTPSAEEPQILLVGDSHMGMLGNVLQDAGIAYAGGGILWGSQWHMLQFQPDPQSIFTPNDEEAKERWARAITELGEQGLFGAERRRLKIITNIGCHSHVLMGGVFLHMKQKYGIVPDQFSIGDIRESLHLQRQPHLEIVKRFMETGHDVIWVGDPPAQDINPELHAVFDTILSQFFASTGARSLNARKWVEQLGGWNESFSSGIIDENGKPDRIHGSKLYYKLLARLLTEDPRIVP